MAAAGLDPGPVCVPAAAVRAAASVAASLGVACADPVILADGANVIVHLRPSPVVAKVAVSTPEVRPDAAAGLRRELDLALFLAQAGAPVMAPSPEIPARAYHRDGHVMSFWTYCPPEGTGRPDAATIGSMLHDLHAVLATYPVPLAPLTPLNDIPSFLARPRTRLSAEDAAILADAYHRLTDELAAASDNDSANAEDTGAGSRAAAQALHGDAGPGNLMATGGGWIWHDFEDTCSGPRAWDLAAATASPRLDRARVLAAYGSSSVDPGLLRTCEQLRRLHLTVWYSLYAERIPDCRLRAAELLASWRAAPA